MLAINSNGQLVTKDNSQNEHPVDGVTFHKDLYIKGANIFIKTGQKISINDFVSFSIKVKI
jgi:uncharacterized Zn ribbon protein